MKNILLERYGTFPSVCNTLRGCEYSELKHSLFSENNSVAEYLDRS